MLCGINWGEYRNYDSILKAVAVICVKARVQTPQLHAELAACH